MLGAGDHDGVGPEIPRVCDGVLALQPILASTVVVVPALIEGFGVGGEVEGRGPAADHGGVLGHVEAAEEGELGDHDEADEDGNEARPSPPLPLGPRWTSHR